MTVKERLIEYLKIKHVGRNKFERAAGISEGYISNLKHAPGAEILVKILNAAPDLNRIWLLTGEGEMLKNTDKERTTETAKLPAPVAKTKPRLPVSAAAGMISEYMGGIRMSQCEQMPVIPRFPSYDFTMVVKGDSMEPKFEGGDEIACTKVYNIVEWGKVYLIDTKDGAFLKRIYEEGDSLRCVSYNSEYPDFSIPKIDINGIYRVVGLLRTAI